jgi:uncharacterized protein (TIGR03382 family)
MAEIRSCTMPVSSFEDLELQVTRPLQSVPGIRHATACGHTIVRNCESSARNYLRSLDIAGGLVRAHEAHTMRNVRLAALLVIGACAAPDATGPVQQLVMSASSEAAVPADLVMAIAVEEGGLTLPAMREVDAEDNVPVAGLLELRRGKLDTLALGAELVHADELAIRGDTELGTRAGALVLARLGQETGAGDALATWRPALEQLSGMDTVSAKSYASRVFAILRTGGDFPARDGERVHIAPHPEIDRSETVETFVAHANTPDYPGAIWFTTSCTDKCTIGRPLGNASVNKIVIHDTEGGWNASVATLQNDPGKSVHYIIDADGSRVGQFRPETDTTYHAGNYYYTETSIGIEHVGFAAAPTGYSKALYTKSADLVKNIRTRWTVPLDRRHIVGHYQIPDGSKISESSPACALGLDACETSANYGGASNHRDPGYNWQWCQYMETLGGTCECNDAWDNWNCTTDRTEAWRCNNGTLESQHCTGPAGCAVMPIGTPDVCDTSNAGSDVGSGAGTDSGSDFGADSGSDLDNPPEDGSGCSTSGRSGGAMLAIALLAMRLRRRR